MNEQELAEIEARANAATPGPWSVQVQHHDTLIYGGPPGGRIDLAKIVPWMTHDKPNADFIAHARQDVPALIAEVRHLRNVVKECCGALEWAEPFLERGTYHSDAVNMAIEIAKGMLAAETLAETETADTTQFLQPINLAKAEPSKERHLNEILRHREVLAIELSPDLLRVKTDKGWTELYPQKNEKLVIHVRDTNCGVCHGGPIGGQGHACWDPRDTEISQAKEWMQKALTELEAAEKVCKTVEKGLSFQKQIEAMADNGVYQFHDTILEQLAEELLTLEQESFDALAEWRKVRESNER